MDNIVIRKTVPLDVLVRPEPLHGMTFTQESGAHTFEITCTRGGQEVTLTGNCTAYFLRTNNTTIVLGNKAQAGDARKTYARIENGKAVVTLHSDCYNVPGRFKLSVFNDSGTESMCVYSCVGVVERTISGTMIDSGAAIPSINDLTNAMTNVNTAIANAEAATTAAEKVNITQTKSGNVITVTTTNRNGANTNSTITEPTATMSKAENGDYTITVTDANGSTSYTIEDTEAAVRKKATIEAVSRVKTALGNPLTMTDGMDAPAVKTVVTLEPKQDLHGYDHPWVGGAGKNLCPNEASTATINEVTFTVNSDGSVKVNGTATGGSAMLYLTVSKNKVLTPGTYTRFLNSDAEFSGVRLQCRIGSAAGADMFGTDAQAQTTTISEDTDLVIRLIVTDGKTVNNVTFYPMIVSGTYTTATFPAWEPYSNICPIEGYDTVRVTATGKNLYDVSQVEIGKNWLHGNATNRAAFAIQTIKGSTLNIMAAQNGDTRRVVIVGANKFGSNAQQSFNKNFQPSIAEIQHTVTADEYAIVQFERLDGEAITQEDIDCWDIAISYTDINTTSLSVAQAAGATVYGGTVTLNEDGSGTLVVDKQYLKGSECTWSVNASNANTFNGQHTYALSIANDTTGYSSAYVMYNSNEVAKHDYGFAHANAGRTLYVKDKDYSDLASFQTHIADVEFVYNLATPSNPINLTADQLRTLTGENHVWTDGTKLELTYRADKYADVEKFLNAIPTGTKTGDPAVFADGADDLPFEKLTIAVEPHQEGSGDPSPDNIRPITGWDDVKVTRCGKNLLPADRTYTVGILDDNGNHVSNSASRYTNIFYGLKPSTQYTISGTLKYSDVGIRLYYRKADGTFISRTGVLYPTGAYTFTTPVNCYGMQVQAHVNLDLSDVQIELGSTATSYEAPVSTTLPISLKYATGSTVYGGTVTINRDGTGSVVVDRAVTTLADKTFSNKQSSALAAGGYVNITGFTNWIDTSTVIKSDMLVGTTFDDRGADGVISPVSNAASVNYLALFTTKTKDEAVAAYKNATICYKLATPTTYTLTAPQLTSLLGNNTVWCDAGQVTVKYKRDIGKALDAMVASLIEAGLYVDMGAVVVEPGA